MNTLYHIMDVTGKEAHRITSKPITLARAKELGGGSIRKLENSGYRLVRATSMAVIEKGKVAGIIVV